jgi:carbamoyl-phosphate synthase small subunit
LLALADGNLFWGESIGDSDRAVGEVVFNTAMTGYQEILTDPSYARQIVTLTYPHIGNVGVNEEDQESSSIYLSGLVIRDLPTYASSWRKQQNLQDYLIANGCVAIAGIDTRRLTRLLRDQGVQSGCILTGENIDSEFAVSEANGFPGLSGMDLAKEVTTQQIVNWQTPLWRSTSKQQVRWHIVAYDFGIKRNILRHMVERGCRVTVVPAQTSAEEIVALKPHGVFLSNGPGDPEPCDYAIEAIAKLIAEKIPTFGICLGCQLLALACGAKTMKMKFGHHGANHPVIELQTGKVIISSQNHGFAVDEATLPDQLRATHRSLFDQSLQGIEHKEWPAFAFQGHPEASPGPHDLNHLFDRFIALMENHANRPEQGSAS